MSIQKFSELHGPEAMEVLRALAAELRERGFLPDPPGPIPGYSGLWTLTVRDVKPGSGDHLVITLKVMSLPEGSATASLSIHEISGGIGGPPLASIRMTGPIPKDDAEAWTDVFRQWSGPDAVAWTADVFERRRPKRYLPSRKAWRPGQ